MFGTAVYDHGICDGVHLLLEITVFNIQRIVGYRLSKRAKKTNYAIRIKERRREKKSKQKRETKCEKTIAWKLYYDLL